MHRLNKKTNSKINHPSADIIRTPLLFIACLFLLLVTFSETALADPASTAVILPLKINTAEADTKVSRRIDKVMKREVKAQNIAMPSRIEASKIFNYQDAWPPSQKALQAFATKGGYRYIITGSLTKLGETMSIDLAILDLHEKTPIYIYKTSTAGTDLRPVMAEIAMDIHNYSNRAALIAKIKIQGNKRIDSGAILRQIDSQDGDTFSATKLNKDLTKIFKMGYFKDVQLDVKNTNEGREITFIIKEKAVVRRIKITGFDEVKEEDIKEVIKIKSNTIFSDQEVQSAITNIEQLYKEKGFYNSKATAKYKRPSADKVEITFEIKEGKKIFIKDIIINGNDTFSDRKIRKSMITKEKGIFSWFTDSGLLKRDMLEHDAARISAFYHNNGFVDAKVGEPEVRHEGKWLYITFNLLEGERYKVGSIDITGDIITDKQKLLDFLKVDEEDFFSRKVLREDILRLTDFYSEKGFAFSDINPLTQKNPDTHTIDVVYKIMKGALVHVNRIIIRGNNRTRDKVIRREMAVKENGIFDASAIKRSHKRLQRIEYFENISVTPEATEDDDLLDVIVEVKEKPTGTFSIGAGYSSVDHLSFMGEVSENNFLGRGQRVSAKANFSSITTQYNLSFTEPRLFDTKILVGFNVYNWAREYDDYTKDSIGASVRFGYPLKHKWRVTLGYGYDDTSLSDFDPYTSAKTIIESATYNVTSSVKSNLSRDSRDRLYNPTTGSTNNLSVKYAGGPLGGDNGFTKLEATSSWYFPLFWEFVFHPKLSGGYIMEGANDDEHLPVFEKFYLGGLNSIRSFNNGEISPEETTVSTIVENNQLSNITTVNRVGGDKMWYSNIEILFPLLKDAGLRGVIFYDMGNVYDTNESWNFTNKKQSAGGGFRWMSPIGPLRLEWGKNLNPEDYEETSSWDFSIGGAF